MATGRFSDNRVEIWLNELQSVWLSLHFADPEINGAYASEVFGGSYGRIKVSFTQPVERVIFLDSDAVFRGLPVVKVTHIGAWDSQYNGNLEFSAPLETEIYVVAGGSVRIGVESLAISLP